MRRVGTTQADTRPPFGHTLETTTREMHHPGGDGNELDVYPQIFQIFRLDHLVLFGMINS